MISGIVVLLLGVVSIFGFMAIAAQPGAGSAPLRQVQRLRPGVRLLLGQPVLFKKEDLAPHPQLRDRVDPPARAEIRRRGRSSRQRPGPRASPSKVNDRDGNPIDISAVVVWRVVNTAEALFEVDDFEDFVAVQSEAALRNMASRHPYDSSKTTKSPCAAAPPKSATSSSPTSRNGSTRPGSTSSKPASATSPTRPEIAAAMLQRQQAQAVVAARTKIVEGAVGMVEMALEDLSQEEHHRA